MKIIHTLLLLLCIATTLKAQQISPAIDAAMANYDYEAALALIAEDTTATLPLLYLKGRALRGLGNNREALQTYEAILSTDTLSLRPYIEAAECLRALSRPKEALQYYEKARTLNPDNKYVALQYISLLLNQKKPAKALYESSLLAETDSSRAVLHLVARSYEALGAAETIECYDYIRRLYPDDYVAVAKMASILNQANYPQDALAVTEAYRETDTLNIDVNRQNALAYFLAKEYPTAIERYKSLLAQGDSIGHTYYYMGLSYYNTGKNYYDARNMLGLALDENPKDVILLYYMGMACARTSWKDDGITYLNTAIELSLPKDSTMSIFYKGLNYAYRIAEKYKEQIDALTTLYNKYDRSNHYLLYNIAYIYQYRLDDLKNAERYLTAFLKTRPADAIASTDTQEPEEVDENNEAIVDKRIYYERAETWLASLKRKRIEEEFMNPN
jgi:tetratricopeptide (TPR) repeat protein